jgi:hypothetical protein
MKMQQVWLAGTAFVLLATVSVAGAQAASNGGGNSANAPGQENATENCEELSDYQYNEYKGNGPGGGYLTGAYKGNGNDPKTEDEALANCDHSWQEGGYIGQ